ncbi:MAG: hypothetical protein H7Z10_04115, partial [Gemmatimonadaceae bacterium]|nr:hypothetical protein [Acetobacteraceae bacterium]
AAIAALQAAGLRADGLARFFQRMERDDVRWVKFLSSHPATAERRQRAQQPDTGESAFTAAEWDAVQAMCTR